MESEERAMRMLQAAEASQTEMRSILRLEQIAIKGSFDPALLTSVELKELCALVLKHLTWLPRKPVPPPSVENLRSTGFPAPGAR